MGELTDARHAQERGEILRVLKEDYGARMTTVLTLLRALDALGISLTPEGLAFHLEYLAEQQYVDVTRARDAPGFRRDRAGSGRPEEIRFCKLRPKGLQLLDGRIEEDPMVTF
ncbi:MAG TPA: hypothetical protein VGM23_05380 [Armatimonadota bacterium]|jgi:predicted ArsR family transcriptional regulator